MSFHEHTSEPCDDQRTEEVIKEPRENFIASSFLTKRMSNDKEIQAIKKRLKRLDRIYPLRHTKPSLIDFHIDADFKKYNALQPDLSLRGSTITTTDQALLQTFAKLVKAGYVGYTYNNRLKFKLP